MAWYKTWWARPILLGLFVIVMALTFFRGVPETRLQWFVALGGGLFMAIMLWKISDYQRDEVRDLARKMGWQHEEYLPPDMLAVAGQFRLLSLDSEFAQALTNTSLNPLISVQPGLRTVLFDGTFPGMSHASIVWFTCDDLSLPSFSLEPEVPGDLGQIFAAWAGDQDIDFDDDPEFSRRCLLKGKEEAAIRTLFNPILRGFIVKRWPSAIPALEGNGKHLLFCWPNKKIGSEVSKAPGLVNEAREVLQALVQACTPAS